MSEPIHPSLQDLLEAFQSLSDRVAESPETHLDPFVSQSLRKVCEELRYFIPGLDAPPDAEAARFLARAAFAAIEDGDSREALSRALRGLSFAPHHPGLFYVASSACFEYGAVEDAVRLLRHTLWIQPGHTAARRDLKSLSAYLQHRWSEPGQGTVDPLSAMAEAEALEPELAFDFIEDAEPMASDASAPETSQDDDDASWDDREDRAA